MTVPQKDEEQAFDSRLPALLTIVESARYLRISRNTAYSEARAGRLPVIRIGRRVLVVRKLLDEMLLACASDAWRDLQVPQKR